MKRVGEIMRSIRNHLMAHAAPYAMGVIVAAALKWHYSVAESEDLCWVLLPTARLVEWLTSITFEWEHHTGFLSRAHGIIIAPSCAGVNFLIIAFCTLYFTTARLMPTARLRVLWPGILVGISYILTIGVNSLRIIASIALYQADIYGGWLTPERVHRMEGSLIYFTALLIAHQVVTRAVGVLLTSGVIKAGAGSGLVPFFWYCLIALGIPLMNSGAMRGGARFVEHGAPVLLVCAVVLVVFMTVSLLWNACFTQRR
ncbi:MAG: exosortase K [Desulfobacteraceae bacterium]|nr:MAG: exosortase K [Desulfobacteraceae bacterium]